MNMPRINIAVTRSESKPQTASRTIRRLHPMPILTPKPTSHPVNTGNVVKKAAPKSVKKLAAKPALSAVMRRILAQYRAGTYETSHYSTRTVQRHLKFFMERGINLRIPFVAQHSLRSTTARPLGSKSGGQIEPVSARRIGSTRCIKAVKNQKGEASHE